MVLLVDNQFRNGLLEFGDVGIAVEEHDGLAGLSFELRVILLLPDMNELIYFLLVLLLIRLSLVPARKLINSGTLPLLFAHDNVLLVSL